MENSESTRPEQTGRLPEVSGNRFLKLLTDGRFPMWADYLVLLGLFLVSQAVAMLVVLVAGIPWPDFRQMGGADEAANIAARVAMGDFNAVTYFVSMACTLGGFLLYRRWRHGSGPVARFSLRGFDPVLLLWGVVFIVVASVVLEPLLALLPAMPDVYGRGAWAMLTVVVMAPLFEEVLFRGVVLEATRARYGVVAAWLLSSLLFGLVHLHPAAVVNAFVVGLILAFVYMRSDSLWATIILHAVNNGVAYVMLVAGHGGSMLIDLIPNRTLYGVIYAVAALLFLVSGYMVWRTLRSLGAREKKPVEA